jgi:hypothetical protein
MTCAPVELTVVMSLLPAKIAVCQTMFPASAPASPAAALGPS